MNRFAAIGIDCEGPDALEATVSRFLPQSRETIYPKGGSVFEWRDPSGAGLLVTTVTVDNIVQCVTPAFTAHATLEASVAAFAPDGDCRFCAPMLLDSDAAGRLAVQLEDSAITRRDLVAGDRVAVAVAAFVDRARVWDDEDSFERDRGRDRMPLPARTVVATGLAGGACEPHAFVSGVVTKTEQLTNEATGRRFVWAEVDAGATSHELVAAPDILPALAPGNFVQTLCWMVGRVVAAA